MIRKSLLALTGIFVLFSVPFGTLAQDAPPLVPATVGDIVTTPDSYVGNTVIVEDMISEYVSPKAFLLGDNAAIGETRVLVINTSGEDLPLNLFVGDRVVVSGMLHYALNTRVTTGEVVLPEDRVLFRREWNMTGSMPEPMMDGTPDMEPTADPMVTPEGTDSETDNNMNVTGQMDITNQRDAFDFYFAGGFPDAYDGYHVLEISNITDISYRVVEE